MVNSGIEFEGVVLSSEQPKKINTEQSFHDALEVCENCPYKGEAYKLFVDLMEEIKNEIISFCFKFFPQEPEEIKEQRKSPQRMNMVKDNVNNMGLHEGHQPDEGARRGKQKPVVAEVKVGRNDPCTCGSGKKYKHCHGKN